MGIPLAAAVIDDAQLLISDYLSITIVERQTLSARAVLVKTRAARTVSSLDLGP